MFLSSLQMLRPSAALARRVCGEGIRAGSSWQRSVSRRRAALLPSVAINQLSRTLSPVSGGSGPGVRAPLRRLSSTNQELGSRASRSVRTEDDNDAAGTPSLPPGVESSGPKMVFMYTCSVCGTRAAKTISKHAYERGTVLIKCPGCQNLHLIADHLGTFEEESFDVVQLLQERGDNVTVVRDGDILELTEVDGADPVPQ